MDTEYLPRLGVLLVRILARHLPNVVVSNSQVTRQTLWGRERSLVIASLAELASPREEPRSQVGPLVVGIVSRLAPWKGQDVFLRAFAEAFPTGEERAIVVGAPLFGQAEIAFADTLRRLSQELNLGSRVEFRGHREDIAAELRTIDILVHASTTPEPFGQVVIEGMSAQMPVVATRGGGPEEIISDGVDGMLYPLGDVAALAHILVRLGGAPQLRARLGRAAAPRTRLLGRLDRTSDNGRLWPCSRRREQAFRARAAPTLTVTTAQIDRPEGAPSGGEAHAHTRLKSNSLLSRRPLEWSHLAVQPAAQPIWKKENNGFYRRP
jgi:glycosyltransferase involved in cell wall biosynthesis